MVVKFSKRIDDKLLDIEIYKGTMKNEFIIYEIVGPKSKLDSLPNYFLTLLKGDHTLVEETDTIKKETLTLKKW